MGFKISTNNSLFSKDLRTLILIQYLFLYDLLGSITLLRYSCTGYLKMNQLLIDVLLTLTKRI